MANIVRSAKSGNNWRPSDLSELNIRIEIVDAPSFFGFSAISKENSLFFRWLGHATRFPPRSCAINDFTAFLLLMLDYDAEPKRLVHLGMELDLMMYGKP
ncbi:hypothetical protein B0H13DRAFT_2364954 [Mycena leptocephala]|nr:hypothetical protein B0H13DRAFT_2364954 [Mycena leptocephala]